MLIKVSFEGRPYWLNPDQIVHLTPTPEGSSLRMRGNVTMITDQTPEELAALINHPMYTLEMQQDGSVLRSSSIPMQTGYKAFGG